MQNDHENRISTCAEVTKMSFWVFGPLSDFSVFVSLTFSLIFCRGCMQQNKADNSSDFEPVLKNVSCVLPYVVVRWVRISMY